MSLDVMSYVWNNSKQKGSAKLVLLAIADNANDHGDAYPGIKKLAKKCSMTERNAQKVIAKLEQDGELKVYSNLGTKTTSGWTNLFRVVMKGVNDTTPLTLPQGVNGTTSHEVSPRSPHRVSPRSPESSVEPSVKPKDKKKKEKSISLSRKKRARPRKSKAPIETEIKAPDCSAPPPAADDGTVTSLEDMQACANEIEAEIDKLRNKFYSSRNKVKRNDIPRPIPA